MAVAAVDAAPASTDVYGELPELGIFEERRVGLSKDDAYLGYEISTCDPCPSEFHFESATKPSISLSYWYHPEDTSGHAEEKQKKNDDAVDAKIQSLGVVKALAGRTLRGPFPYPDLRFAVTTKNDETMGKQTLMFGAHVVGKPPVYPMSVALGPHPGLQEPLLVYANVTTDGRDIAIVAVAMGSGWYEAAAMSRMPTATFAKRVHDETAKLK